MLSFISHEPQRVHDRGQFAPWIDATGGGTEARFINPPRLCNAAM
jgi:hypothetical protein